MATRRSRLAVRPNIGGVKSGLPKPPTRKPSPAIPTSNEENSSTQDKPASPTVSQSTDNAHINKTDSNELKSNEPETTKATGPTNRVLESGEQVQDTTDPESVALTSVTNKTEMDTLYPSVKGQGVHVESTLKRTQDTQTLPNPTEKKGPDTDGSDTIAISETGASITELGTSEPSPVSVPAASNNDLSSSLPSRARLRRFGKVNIPSAVRGVAPKVTSPVKSPRVTSSSSEIQKDTKSPKKVVKDTTNTGQDSQTSIKDKESVVNLRSKLTAVKEKGDDLPLSVESQTPDTMPRIRGRLPKTKPNLADLASRRPKKQVTTSQSVADSPVTDKSIDSSNKTISPVNGKDSRPVTVGLPKVSLPPTEPANQDSQSTEAEETIVSSGESQSPQLTAVQPKPVVPRSPVKSMKGMVTPSVLISPVKQPGDKRARTISTTEAPVVKRRKKPKVKAPTDKPPDRTAMRMGDLIHWNPSNNPMKAKETGNTVIKPTAIEVEAPNKPGKDEMSDEDTSLPMPQVTIGPDGNIVINEQSLVMKNPDEDKGPKEDDSVIDETEIFSTYGSFKSKKRTRNWSKKETLRFYKALGMVGIDFFLINQVFPDRSRFEVKMKFKREEKQNSMLVERVLRNSVNFDESLFDLDQQSTDSEEEAKVAKKKLKAESKRVKKAAVKNEKKSEKDENKAAGPKKRGRPSKKKSQAQKSYFEDSSDSGGGKTEKLTAKVVERDMSCALKAANDLYTIEIGSPDAASRGEVNSSSENCGLHNNSQVNGKAVQFANQDVTAMQSLYAGTLSDTPVTSSIIVPVFNSLCSASDSPGGRVAETFTSDVVGNTMTSPVATQRTAPPNVANDAMHMLPAITLPPGTDSDQFVLVTVQPENGEDTVIHIYRVHGNDPQTAALDMGAEGMSREIVQLSGNSVDERPALVASDVTVSSSDIQTEYSPMTPMYTSSEQYSDGVKPSVEILTTTCSNLTSTDLKCNEDLQCSSKLNSQVKDETVRTTINSQLVSLIPQTDTVNTSSAVQASDLTINSPVYSNMGVSHFDSATSAFSSNSKCNKISVTDHLSIPLIVPAEPVSYTVSVTDGDFTEAESRDDQAAIGSTTQSEDKEIIVESEEMLNETMAALLS